MVGFLGRWYLGWWYLGCWGPRGGGVSGCLRFWGEWETRDGGYLEGIEYNRYGVLLLFPW